MCRVKLQKSSKTGDIIRLSTAFDRWRAARDMSASNHAVSDTVHTRASTLPSTGRESACATGPLSAHPSPRAFPMEYTQNALGQYLGQAMDNSRKTAGRGSNMLLQPEGPVLHRSPQDAPCALAAVPAALDAVATQVKCMNMAAVFNAQEATVAKSAMRAHIQSSCNDSTFTAAQRAVNICSHSSSSIM
jgi:hypothetical protein